MKSIKVFCCIAMMLCASPLFAEEETAFLLANQAYKSGDFAKAYELYETIPEKNSAIYYNLGNCAYKMGNLGYAMLHWRRAERNWGFWGREELSANMQLLRKKIHSYEDGHVEPNPLTSLLAMGKTLRGKFVSAVRATPLLALQLIVLLLWILLFLMIRYLFRHKHRFIIITLFVAQTAVAGMLALKYSYSLKTFGVIVAKTTPLMSGPGKTYTSLVILPEAKECVILKESEGYYKIKVNGSMGWVEKPAVGVI